MLLSNRICGEQLPSTAIEGGPMREFGGSFKTSSVIALHGSPGGPQSGPPHAAMPGAQTVGKLPPPPPMPLEVLLLWLPAPPLPCVLLLEAPPAPPVLKSRGAGEQP